jgi:hypothetical protein
MLQRSQHFEDETASTDGIGFSVQREEPLESSRLLYHVAPRSSGLHSEPRHWLCEGWPWCAPRQRSPSASGCTRRLSYFARHRVESRARSGATLCPVRHPRLLPRKMVRSRRNTPREAEYHRRGQASASITRTCESSISLNGIDNLGQF